MIQDKNKAKPSSLNGVNSHREVTKDINFLTMESLILAQDERWRRASYMQVERESDFGQRKVADG